MEAKNWMVEFLPLKVHLLTLKKHLFQMLMNVRPTHAEMGVLVLIAQDHIPADVQVGGLDQTVQMVRPMVINDYIVTDLECDIPLIIKCQIVWFNT